MRAAIYTRVSTLDQNPDLQECDLRAYAAGRGWEVVQAYEDRLSAAAARRPALLALLEAAGQRRFDVVLVWKLDRFGRSLVHCLQAVSVLESHGVRFIATTQALDTDERNPASRLLLHVLAAAAEFERSLIRERASAGLRRYQMDYSAGRVGKLVHSRSGKNLPPGRPRRIVDAEAIHELRRRGWSWQQIGERLEISPRTARRRVCPRN